MSISVNIRDHLANERTFLAWFRTAISLLGFGVLIAKLRFLPLGAALSPSAGTGSARLGLAFAVSGLLTLLLATWQYVRTKRMIDSGAYQAPVSLIYAFSAVAVALALSSVVSLVGIFK